MRQNRELWRVKAVGTPASAQSREANAHWYSFLEEECRKENGLLCFYDRHKSPEVAYFCGLLARCLMSAPEKTEKKAEVSKLFDLQRLPDLEENLLKPARKV